jgi:hypothetical protein
MTGRCRSGLQHGPPVEIDEYLVVECAPVDAAGLFAHPSAIAAWFGARREDDRTVTLRAACSLRIHVADELWLPDDHALLVSGVIERVRYRSHVTLRAVAAPRCGDPWAAATEVWVHVELERGPGVRRIRSQLVCAVRRGLEHIRTEMDCRPDSD